jgi:hypothetical protein
MYHMVGAGIDGGVPCETWRESPSQSVQLETWWKNWVLMQEEKLTEGLSRVECNTKRCGSFDVLFDYSALFLVSLIFSLARNSFVRLPVKILGISSVQAAY